MANGNYFWQTNMKNKSTPLRNHGWGNSLADLFGARTKKYNDPANLGKWFREYANTQGIDASVSSYLNTLSDADLGSLLEEFWGSKGSEYDFLNTSGEAFDTESALRDLKALSSINLPEPSKSFQDIWNESSAAIDAENAKAIELYDNALNQQRMIYNNNLNNLNRGYNNYANQVLAMDYQKNAQLLGGLSNDMSKARQNALEAGASAGIRLANNVNTLMSTQNQQAAQSLQTSNNLAQMLMNQRNAAMGLQSNLANAYSNNANQKAGLITGTHERKQANAGQAWDLYQQSYNDQVNRATSGLEGNAFKDSYLKTKQNQPVATGNNGY